MRTPYASAALIVLILTPVALAVTITLLPAALMFLPFLPLLGVVALLALARPGAASLRNSQVPNMSLHDLML